MEITSTQHVQVPSMDLLQESLKHLDPYVYACIKKYMNNETKLAFPSLATLQKDSGLSAHAIKDSIKRLVDNQYITITYNQGSSNIYTFDLYKSFEIFSYEFLNNENLTPKEKAYLIASQLFMYKHPELNEGIITYNQSELADCLDLNRKTLRSIEKSLQTKGIMSILPYKADQETGLPLQARHYDFENTLNIIAMKFMEQDVKLDQHEDRLNQLEKQLQLYAAENRALKKQLDLIEDKHKHCTIQL